MWHFAVQLITLAHCALHAHMNYSRTSMAQTLMAHSPWLARTTIMVPTGCFMNTPPWMAGTTLGYN